jgi:hypothetical protein
LLEQVQAILGEQFVGMYLHGSLAAGDFDPARSDIDWLVITRTKLSDDLLTALETMHVSISNSGFAWRMNHEGSYIPQEAIRRYDPQNDVHPALGTGGHFHMMEHGSGWIMLRHIARKYGITLTGTNLADLIELIAPDDLRTASKGILREWWQPMLDDITRLDDDEYQAYAVLTMCRILYTIANGDVVSKPIAAAWAQEHLDKQWSPLIQQAMTWQHGMAMNALDAVVAFIHYTVERASD